MTQTIKTSIGCPYKCPFCFNGDKEFEELPIPKIISENVIILDDAFLSKKDVLETIKRLGKIKHNGKKIKYEIKQGINKKDLTQEIANELHKNNFINIRFAWDGSYTKKNMYLIIDTIKMLTKAGYKKKELICYILSNYYISFEENMLKLDMLKVLGIPVCNCVFRKKYLDPKIYSEAWTDKEIKHFRTTQCRRHNQLIKFDGYDPEIEKRLINYK